MGITYNRLLPVIWWEGRLYGLSRVIPGFFCGAPPYPGVTTSGPPSNSKNSKHTHSSQQHIAVRTPSPSDSNTANSRPKQQTLFFFFSAQVCALWPLQLCRVQGVGCRAAYIQNKYFYKLQMWQGQRLKAVYLYFSGIFRQ